MTNHFTVPTIGVSTHWGSWRAMGALLDLGAKIRTKGKVIVVRLNKKRYQGSNCAAIAQRLNIAF